MPARPSISLSTISTKSLASTASMNWPHVREANMASYVVIGGDNNIFNDFPYLETVTFNGEPAFARYRWNNTAVGFKSLYVFGFPATASGGSGTLQFNAVDVSNYTAHAFNVANAPIDACIILGGGYAVGSGNVPRNVYAWDPDGLQIAVTWINQSTNPLSTIGATMVSTSGGLSIGYANATDDMLPLTFRSPIAALTANSFLIPAAHARSGGSYQPWFQAETNISSFTPSSSALAGLPYGSGSAGNCAIIPCAGTLRSFVVRLSAPPGSGNTVTAEIYRGGLSTQVTGIGSSIPLPTGVAITISNSNTVASLDGLDLSWAKYERLAIRYSMTGGTLPSSCTATSSMLVETAEEGVQIYGGGGIDFGSSVVDTAARRAPLHPDVGNPWSTLPGSEKSLAGVDITMDEILVDFQTEVTVNPDHEYYEELNGVEQNGSGATVDTKAVLPINTCGRAIARKRFSLPIVAGDLFAHVDYRRTGGTVLRQAVTWRGIASVPGQVMISGHTDSTGVPYYALLNSSRLQRSGAEVGVATVTNIVPPVSGVNRTFDILGLRAYLDPTGPGTAETLTERLRVNLSDTSMPDLVMTGSPATPLMALVGGNVVTNDLDLLSTYWFGTGGSLSRQFYTIPGFIEPPGEEPEPEQETGSEGHAEGGSCPNLPVGIVLASNGCPAVDSFPHEES